MRLWQHLAITCIALAGLFMVAAVIGFAISYNLL